MTQNSLIRRAVLAGALALSALGASAGAEAMPVAASAALQPASPGLSAVQYRYRRSRRAGLYNCGRGGLDTHLSRQACGTSSTSKRFLYRR